MAGVQGAGGTGAAGGGGDALFIQQQQQGLPFDPLEAHVHIPRQPPGRIAVQRGVGDGGKAGDQPVPQRREVGGVLFYGGTGLVKGGRSAADAGDVLRAAPLPPLLGTAMDQRSQRNTAPGVQHSHALGPMELMGGEGQQVHLHRLHIDGQVACRLDRVRVKQDPRLAADGADLGNGLDGADLVVGKHDAHQTSVRPDGIPDLLRRHHAVRRNVQQGYFKALPLQGLEGMEHGMVLEFR